jgi:hypothetical protein
MRFFNRGAPLHPSGDIRTPQPCDHLAAPGGPSTSAVSRNRSERRQAGSFGLRRKLLVGLISILSSMSIAVAAASPAHSRRHIDHAGPDAAMGRARSFEPPRMIEVRPGWWISTYDCITDEGQGRWRPCSAGGGS